MTQRNFLTVDDLTAEELHRVLDLADELREARRSDDTSARDDLAGLSIGMIFEKPSTRTRVSFEVGIAELGARPVVLSASELQLGRGETVEDTAAVLSRFLHGLVVRTFAQERLTALAGAGTIPVVNALSDYAHPCQALADLQTIRGELGELAGRKLAYLGDGNNVAHSLLRAGALAGMTVAVACPQGYEPDAAVVQVAEGHAAQHGGAIVVTHDPAEAASEADVVYTDVWTSMGQEEQAKARLDALQPFQVNSTVLRLAKPEAIALHCLPAHRGQEIAADVLDGPQARVWDQAENRLHAQKALLLLLYGKA